MEENRPHERSDEFVSGESLRNHVLTSEGCDMTLSNRTKLNDDDRMPFGKYRDEPLGKVPDSYWRWFLGQGWCDQYPDLVEYANLIEDE